MSNTLQFELTSPDMMAFNKPVSMVIVPGSAGLYGVLPGHAPMVTMIAPGMVEVYEKSEQSLSEKFFVTGGYCEVTTDRCSLLADEILPVSGFVRADLQNEIKELIRERGELGPDDSDEEIEKKLAIAMAKLQVAA